MPYSDLIDKKVNYFTLVQNDSGNSNYTFRSWNGYGNLDVLLSIQLENLIIDIGGELNYLGYTIDYFHNSIDGKIRAYGRSEEHTSELQSRPHLVCRLLLEKKKKKKNKT